MLFGKNSVGENNLNSTVQREGKMEEQQETDDVMVMMMMIMMRDTNFVTRVATNKRVQSNFRISQLFFLCFDNFQVSFIQFIILTFLEGTRLQNGA